MTPARRIDGCWGNVVAGVTSRGAIRSLLTGARRNTGRARDRMRRRVRVTEGQEAIDATDLDAAAAVFAHERRRLFGIAYRMLAALYADAETWCRRRGIRWQHTDRRSSTNRPHHPPTTVTTRLCINEVQSAHSRRGALVGPWLPRTREHRRRSVARCRAQRSPAVRRPAPARKLTPDGASRIRSPREALDYPYERILRHCAIDRTYRATTSEPRTASTSLKDDTRPSQRTSTAISWRHSSAPRKAGMSARWKSSSRPASSATPTGTV